MERKMLAEALWRCRTGRGGVVLIMARQASARFD
jgi:hypothetical protein